MADREDLQGATEVQASLERVGGKRKFVIENVGDVMAQSLRFTVQAERGKNPPVSAHDLEDLFPLEQLEPGASVAVEAIITPGTGLHFRGVVTWVDPEGTEQERVYYMSA